MLRAVLLVTSLVMLTGGALSAQSAIGIANSVGAEPAEQMPGRNKIVRVVRWERAGALTR